MVLQVRADQLVHWSSVAHQGDQEALNDFIRKPFVPIKLIDVEQVTRVLTIERRTQLSSK